MPKKIPSDYSIEIIYIPACHALSEKREGTCCAQYKDPLKLNLQNGYFVVREDLGWLFAVREPYKLGLGPVVVDHFTLHRAEDLKNRYPNRSFKRKRNQWSKRVEAAIEQYMLQRDV